MYSYIYIHVYTCTQEPICICIKTYTYIYIHAHRNPSPKPWTHSVAPGEHSDPLAECPLGPAFTLGPKHSDPPPDMKPGPGRMGQAEFLYIPQPACLFPAPMPVMPPTLQYRNDHPPYSRNDHPPYSRNDHPPCNRNEQLWEVLSPSFPISALVSGTLGSVNWSPTGEACRPVHESQTAAGRHADLCLGA